MSECNQSNCASCGVSGCSKKAVPDKEPLNQYSLIRHTVAIVSGKGGVGKSLVTSLMAAGMQKKGYRTAIIDADITGPSIPKAFGLNDIPGNYEDKLLPVASKGGTQIMSVNLLMEHATDPVIWRSPIVTNTVKQFWSEVVWDNIDYMFVDMPPGTGDVPITVFQAFPLSGIIIVASPQDLVSMIVEKAVKMAEMYHVPILALVENMSYFVCPNCKEKHRIFGDHHIAELAERYQIPAVCEIPIDPSIAEAVDAGNVESIDATWLESLMTRLEALN